MKIYALKLLLHKFQKCNVILKKAVNDNQNKAVGNQCGGEIFIAIFTNDFEVDYIYFISNNVPIIGLEINTKRRRMIFEDLYGKKMEIIENIN